MDWLPYWRHVIAAVAVTVISIEFSDGECPEAYWDEPSKKCSSSLLSTLEKLRSDDRWNPDLRNNRTCTSWQQTDVCYRKLMKLCHSDDNAINELRMHSGRYLIYSLTCSAQNSRQRQVLIECFIPHIKLTRTCTEVFDKYFRNYVAEKQYRNACRVVSSAMKCFDEIKKEISSQCQRDGGDEYQRNYIQPLVDQTRNVVLSRCTISSPYDQYFNVAAPSSEHRIYTYVHRLCTAYFALLVTRWRHRL